MTFSAGDLVFLVPMIVLMATGILLVLAEAFFIGRDRVEPDQ